MDLQQIREQLDGIDQNIVSLFQERMELSKEVAQYKINTGKSVLDKEREASKMKTLTSLAQSELNRHGIEELFTQIMAMSRKLQYQMLQERGFEGKLSFFPIPALSLKQVRVVYQGVEGAYSHAAMKQFFGDQVSNFHVEKWRDAMEAIAEGIAEYAVLPIENSTAGIVSEIYDLLVEFDNYIVGEQIISCNHALLGLQGTQLSDIKTVYSHPQALMQCSRFLNEHREWVQRSFDNTAMSAEKVLNDQDGSQAAIASVYAAQHYGLDVLQENINNSNTNSTRFIIVTNQRVYVEDAKKISICFEISHESGSLYNVLSHFIYNNLNMTKIESRPIEGRNWEYRFFVDFEGNFSEGSVKNALRGILEETSNFKILGNY